MNKGERAVIEHMIEGLRAYECMPRDTLRERVSLVLMSLQALIQMDELNRLEVGRPEHVRARKQASAAIGSQAMQALSQQALSVGWRHQWHGLWRWYDEAREVLAEVIIDPRCPEDVQIRLQGILEREV